MQEVWKPVAARAEQHDAKWAIIQPLLERDARIDRDENVEFAGHRVEKPTIRQIGPTEIDDGSNLMPRDFGGRSPRDAVVEEHPHLHTASWSFGGGLGSLGDGGPLCHFEHGDSVFPCDMGKVLQDLV
jgi:hypothetical protein